MSDEKRIAGEYEIKQAIHIGDREIVFGEDSKQPDKVSYLVGDYYCNDLFGSYQNTVAGSDYLEMMQEFLDRVSLQIESLRTEISQTDISHEPILLKDCIPDDRSKSIKGKVIAIKADCLRPEYRRAASQLYLVTGGHGAQGNSRGNAVFCDNLHSGEHTRFERYDVMGVVRADCLPEWAKLKAHEMLASNTNPI